MENVFYLEESHFGNFIKEFCKPLKGIYDLTDKEYLVLSSVFLFGGIDTLKRKRIQELLQISPAQLNNLIKSMKDKGIFVINDQKKTYLNPTLYALSKKIKGNESLSIVLQFIYNPESNGN
jgi:DNA-binding MarR family transcriptional regulator